DPKGVDGTGVVTVIAHGDHPEWYGLPRDPHVPLGIGASKHVLKPIGLAAFFGAIAAVVLHYLRMGPEKPHEEVYVPPPAPPPPPPERPTVEGGGPWPDR